MAEAGQNFETEIVRALELLRESPAEAPADLPDKAMEPIHDAIAAGDLVELATSVMVLEFLCPILDVFAFALGLTDENGSPE